MANKVVSDSGPIIHLSEIGRVESFSLFQPVFVPKPVYKEIKTKNQPGFKEIDRTFFVVESITKKDTVNIKMLTDRFKISNTDASVLALAQRIRAGIIFTDDLELRETSYAIGFKAVGTIGILLRAFKEKCINPKELNESLDDLLENSSLFITEKLIVSVKNAVKSKKSPSK